MEKKLVCIAIGGNAIKQAKQKGTSEEQIENVRITCEQVVKINEMGYKVILTHGNGPQAGSLLIQQEEGKALVPSMPLDVCGAMTQGHIGYMFQNQMQNLFKKAGKDVPIATIVTQVMVSKDDPDFQDPSKPVGPFYSEAEAMKLKEEKGYIVKHAKPTAEKGWRRVVPSPEPSDIVETKCIKAMLDARAIVIAYGGGGIPVTIDSKGELVGVEAVIDKDKAGNVLCQKVGGNILVILTDVENAMINFGKENQKALGAVTLDEMKKYSDEGHFMAGSMGPKVIACMRFVEAGGEKSIITSLAKAADALEGKAGTIITK